MSNRILTSDELLSNLNIKEFFVSQIAKGLLASGKLKYDSEKSLTDKNTHAEIVAKESIKIANALIKELNNQP